MKLLQPHHHQRKSQPKNLQKLAANLRRKANKAQETIVMMKILTMISAVAHL